MRKGEGSVAPQLRLQVRGATRLSPAHRRAPPLRHDRRRRSTATRSCYGRLLRRRPGGDTGGGGSLGHQGVCRRPQPSLRPVHTPYPHPAAPDITSPLLCRLHSVVWTEDCAGSTPCATPTPGWFSRPPPDCFSPPSRLWFITSVLSLGQAKRPSGGLGQSLGCAGPHAAPHALENTP